MPIPTPKVKNASIYVSSGLLSIFFAGKINAVTQIFQKFKNDITAILFLFGALFLALSLFSFNPSDPSFNSIGREFSSKNLCGIFGSFVADAFYQLFGISSWIFVVSFANFAWRGFRGDKFDLKRVRYVWGALLIACFSGLLALHFRETMIFQNQVYLSGLLGIGIYKVLVGLLNQTGVQLLLWCMTTVLIVFYSERTVAELISFPKQVLQTAWKVVTGLWRKVGSFRIHNPEKKKIDPTESLSQNNKPIFKITRSTETLQSEILSAPLLKNTNTDSLFEKVAIPEELPTRRKSTSIRKTPRKIENWEMPKLSLLEDPPATRSKLDRDEIKKKAEILTDKLRHFSVEGQIMDVKPGPLVTMYEFKPNADVKLSKITELQDDLSLALSSESLRVIAPIPGRDVVGIETSNSKRDMIYYKDLITDDPFWAESTRLPIALGRQVNGEPKIVDLRKMPHLLVAGTTGSGKSVFITSVITGLLFRHSPKTLRLILVDPKQVDLAAFANVPHLLMPPVTDPKKAVNSLKWAIREMEKRYRSMSRFGARGLEAFNEIVSKLSLTEIEEHEKTNFELETGAGKFDQYYYQPQPYIVIVVEEFGDLMAVDKGNVEQAVVRLAQMARACGIHLILAMQSPRKEVVTGLIKTNIPGRIGLKVASKMDSRIILDEAGAERLLPNGDMLFLAPGVAKPMRHHGPFLSETEICSVAEFWSKQSEPLYDSLALKFLDGFNSEGATETTFANVEGSDADHDELYVQILAWASEQKQVSASLIQRRFRLGYPRAARLIEIFEREGVVGPANGSKPRAVLLQNANNRDISSP